MHKADKKILYTALDAVSVVADHLTEYAERTKDQELRRFLRGNAEDLRYVCRDTADTVDRF